MMGMMRYSQLRLHEMECAMYAKMKGIHARKRFQIKPVCRVVSVYATLAATRKMQVRQAMLSRKNTAMLCRFRKIKFLSLLYMSLFTQKYDQVNIAGGMAEFRQDGCGFASVLCAVVDHMHHHLPEDIFVCVPFGSFVLKS